jgi:hypothetical protein
MSQAIYPLGDARSIAAARSNGLAPAFTVLISMVGRMPWKNPQVFVEAGKRYRWDWLKGLGAVVLVKPGCDLGCLLADIEKDEPSQLDVIDVERRAGWLINWASPGRIVSIRWPQAFVDDWLGPQVHHIAIRRATAEARELIAANEVSDNELEAAWN